MEKFLATFLKSGSILESLHFVREKLFLWDYFCARIYESCTINLPQGSFLLFSALGNNTKQEFTFGRGKNEVICILMLSLSLCFSGSMFIYIKGFGFAFSPGFPPLFC